MNNTKYKPILDRLLIEVKDDDNISDGGIVLLDAPKHEYPPKQAKVIAVGEGEIDGRGKRIDMTCVTGDSIMFDSRAGVKLEGNLLMITEQDVIGVI